MDPLASAIVAAVKVREAHIEIARLMRLVDEQQKIVNIEHARVEAYLSITEAMRVKPR